MQIKLSRDARIRDIMASKYIFVTKISTVNFVYCAQILAEPNNFIVSYFTITHYEFIIYIFIALLVNIIFLK